MMVMMEMVVTMRPVRFSRASWTPPRRSSIVLILLEMPSKMVEMVMMVMMEMMAQKTLLGTTLTRTEYGMTRLGTLPHGIAGDLMMAQTTISPEQTSMLTTGQEQMTMTGSNARPAKVALRCSTSKTGTTTKDIQHEQQHLV